MTRPWLVTGLTGTLAPHVAHALQAQGHTVTGWDRHTTPADDSPAAHAHLHTLNPQGILHLALGSETWAHALATHAHATGIPFVHTSTAMVYSAQAGGPHHPTQPTHPDSDYGHHKARTEHAIRNANPHAVIARIGWQIHPTATGNNMTQQLQAQHDQNGVIRASRHWTPATSFMTDTAHALATLAQDGTTGTVHLDSNAHDALTFPELVRGLARHLNRDWVVEETDDYTHDQRLVDDTTRLPSLRERLGLA
ncbi:sugar nucleotide-binding protein [Deinococcus sp. UR1]|uniref:sugar nucleotide-binding protein n=1 Tax=Deinococcus sp. UR1 TaxID=1704277 RepID=UPI000C174505|nr:sugar nucleotide-binding protein [Deinococcus sp. UR1]PIG99005.1 hypothetical protein AMD26_007100 [Deinococcus sp. UR1]